jgi:IS5 family transposase
MRRAQLSFGDGLIAEKVSDLLDHWMAAADRVLADAEIITAVYEALAQRRPKSRSRGRKGTDQLAAPGSQAYAQLEL